jgi:hypothetical protein
MRTVGTHSLYMALEISRLSLARLLHLGLAKFHSLYVAIALLVDETAMGPNEYYVFGVRSNYPAPRGAGKDWVGSGLVGWYAVRISNGELRDWDMANLKLGAILK